MKAPISQRSGKKIPKKNIHPWPFLSVLNPRNTSRITYKMKPPMPIPHHIDPPSRLLVRSSRIWTLSSCGASPDWDDFFSRVFYVSG